MIIFKHVSWKNMLSTGNAGIEVDLRRSPTTLIVGENGAGKSTILDAICFALFNNDGPTVCAHRSVLQIQCR